MAVLTQGILGEVVGETGPVVSYMRFGQNIIITVIEWMCRFKVAWKIYISGTKIIGIVLFAVVNIMPASFGSIIKVRYQIYRLAK